MNKTLKYTAAGVAAFAAGFASAQTYSSYPAYGSGYGYDNAGVVRCESINSRRTFCRVDTRGGVQIARQLSQRTCIRGRNWDATRDGIAVTDGCRAEFLIGSRNGYQATNGYYTTDRYGRRIYTSTYPTIGNGYYTTDRYGRRIYNRGYAQAGYYGDGARTIHCQSTGYGRTYCGVRGSHYTMVDRSPSCLVNRTWGDDAYGTWVSGNCNADFALSTYPADQDYSPVDEVYERNRDAGPYGVYTPGTDPYRTPTSSYGYGQDVIYCQASPGGRTYCGDRTIPYSIRRDSNAYCVEGETYGRDSYGTWVANGCNLTLVPEDG